MERRITTRAILGGLGIEGLVLKQLHTLYCKVLASEPYSQQAGVDSTSSPNVVYQSINMMRNRHEIAVKPPDM